jgi:hypothetical protein
VKSEYEYAPSPTKSTILELPLVLIIWRKLRSLITAPVIAMTSQKLLQLPKPQLIETT